MWSQDLVSCHQIMWRTTFCSHVTVYVITTLTWTVEQRTTQACHKIIISRTPPTLPVGWPQHCWATGALNENSTLVSPRSPASFHAYKWRSADETTGRAFFKPTRIGNYCYSFTSSVRLVIKFVVCSQLVLATLEAPRMHWLLLGSWSIGKRDVRFQLCPTASILTFRPDIRTCTAFRHSVISRRVSTLVH